LKDENSDKWENTFGRKLTESTIDYLTKVAEKKPYNKEDIDKINKELREEKLQEIKEEIKKNKEI